MKKILALSLFLLLPVLVMAQEYNIHEKTVRILLRSSANIANNHIFTLYSHCRPVDARQIRCYATEKPPEGFCIAPVMIRERESLTGQYIFIGDDIEVHLYNQKTDTVYRPRPSQIIVVGLFK